MFGVVLKMVDGRHEMAIKKLFTSKKLAEDAMKTLIADFGPELSKRYAVVELTTFS